MKMPISRAVRRDIDRRAWIAENAAAARQPLRRGRTGASFMPLDYMATSASFTYSKEERRCALSIDNFSALYCCHHAGNLCERVLESPEMMRAESAEREHG